MLKQYFLDDIAIFVNIKPSSDIILVDSWSTIQQFESFDSADNQQLLIWHVMMIIINISKYINMICLLLIPLFL